MGVISRYRFASQGITADRYKAYLDTLDCPIMTSVIDNGDLFIHVDNAYNIVISFNNNRLGYQLHDITHYITLFNGYNPQSIVICFSDDVFYLQQNGEYGAGRRLLSVYEKVDEKRYVANIGSGTDSDQFHSWYSIQDLTFECLEDGLIYKHDSRLKYTQKIDYIDYTVDNLLTAGGEITNTVDPNFVSCSNVIENSMLTFNDQNFYAIGSNILFPTD